MSVFPFTRSAPSATVKQPDSPVNCDVTPHLDWFNWGPSCVVNVVEKQCFHTHTAFIFFCLCAMSRCFSFQLPVLIYCSIVVSPNWTFDYPPFRFPLLASFFSSPLLCCIRGEAGNVLFCHYSDNIYTTLSKLHLAGSVFQRLSTPHGVAGGLASIKCSAAKIGGRNEENGCTW